MAKKQPKTEADFTVSISHDDLAKFANPTTVKFTDDTANMAWAITRSRSQWTTCSISKRCANMRRCSTG